MKSGNLIERPELTKKEFYTLSWTKGILMSLAGALVAFVLICTGHRPKKHGWCTYFNVGKNWGGLSLGMFFFTDQNNHLSTRWHEHGHAIQNCFYGPKQVIVTIQSACRYHKLMSMAKAGKPITEKYDDAWYEGEATALGRKYSRLFTKE